MLTHSCSIPPQHAIKPNYRPAHPTTTIRTIQTNEKHRHQHQHQIEHHTQMIIQTEAASVLLSSGITSKAEEHERLLLVQMEIERVRWLLRSYLRTRTHKVGFVFLTLIRQGIFFMPDWRWVTR